MIYLASRYSHPNEAVRQERFESVEMCAAHLMEMGKHVFSPIVYGHAMAVRYNLPTDAAYWWKMNRKFIDMCDEVYVLALPGFDESKGLMQELNYSLSVGKTRTYVDQYGLELVE